MPRVSVIIPTYNCAACICETIESIRAQTMQDFDLYVVDDGSTDHTEEVLRRYQWWDKFHYFRQVNRGPSAARNKGVSLAQGRYIAFVDADDTLAPEALECMSNAIEGSDAGWCFCATIRIREDSQKIHKTATPTGDPLVAVLRGDIGRGVFYRRADFLEAGGFDEDLVAYEDWDMNLRMIEQGKIFTDVDRPLYRYRQRSGSITDGQRPSTLACLERLLRKHHKRLADGGSRAATKIYAERMWDLARSYKKWHGNYGSALRCARESLRYDFSLHRLLHPLFFRAQKS